MKEKESTGSSETEITPFERRSNHSIRCLDSVWSEAREASYIAGCSYSVFGEAALLLLAKLVKEHGVTLREYKSAERWLHEKIDSQGEQAALDWLIRKGIVEPKSES